jgi:hypothetical protein
MKKHLHNLDDCFEREIPQGNRRIAWNGISFCVPSNWEMAVYRLMRRGVSRIELEDEYSVRVEAEWIRAKHRLKLDGIMERYVKASKPLTLKSVDHKEIGGLPEGWHATRFVMKETDAENGSRRLTVTRHELVTAFYMNPQTSLFCCVLLHSSQGDGEDSVETIKLLASTFQDHDGSKLIPWVLFDIGFSLSSDFALEKASFDIGCKKMVFKWKSRHLYLWHFSCADIFLKDEKTPAHWSSGYLNSFSGIHGPVFYPDNAGNIAWRRRRPFLFGHRTEIARMCHRYKTGWHLDEAENRLVVWVFNYRREDDLKMVDSASL